MAFNPLQDYLMGNQAGRQQQSNTLAGNVAGQMQNPEFNARNSTDFMRLQALDPERASKSLEAFQNLSKERKKAYFEDMVIGRSLLEANDIAGFGKLIKDRLSNLKRLGSEDTTGTEMTIDRFNQGDIQGIMQGLNAGINAGRQLGYIGGGDTGKTAGQREWEDLTAGLSKNEQQLAKRIKLGLDPRAMGSASQTISQDQALTNQVAASEAAIEGAKEGAKLKEQFKLKPDIAYAVGLATGAATLASKATEEGRSNSKAMNVYEIGINSLADAFGNTDTGPIMGRLPALTSSAQNADGAIAMMGPLLKQVFREAGEGTFTEGDQKQLNDMLPKRSDTPETVQWKIEAITNLINAKLSSGTQPSPTVNQQAPAQGGFKILSVN
jgi:hypothetical protein